MIYIFDVKQLNNSKYRNKCLTNTYLKLFRNVNIIASLSFTYRVILGNFLESRNETKEEQNNRRNNVPKKFINVLKSRITYTYGIVSGCSAMRLPEYSYIVLRYVNVTVADGIPVDVGSTARSVNLAQKLSRNYWRNQ